MFARFDRMAKTFTKMGKEIAISARIGGALPSNNPRLRVAIQNAKKVNMPKDRIEAAIKRASSREEKDYQEIVYEGFAPHGIPILVECATDNPTRTVANIRVIFSKNGGSIGNAGSVSFMFTRKGVFLIEKKSIDMNQQELDFIEAGADDIEIDDEAIIIYTQLKDFGSMQAYIEKKNIEVIVVATRYLPNNHKTLSGRDKNDVLKLVTTLEQDSDVQNVYHNLS